MLIRGIINPSVDLTLALLYFFAALLLLYLKISTHLSPKGPCLAARFSPDGRLVAIGVARGVEIWEVPGKKRGREPMILRKTFGGQSDVVTCIDWSTDGRHLVAGSNDMTCRVFYMPGSVNRSINGAISTAPAGFVPTTLSGHRDIVKACFFMDSSNSGEDGNSPAATIISVAQDCGVFVWDFLPQHTSTENNSHQFHLYCASQGAWKLRIKKFARPARNSTQQYGCSITSAAFQKQRALLVLGFSNGVFGLYGMPNSEPIHTLSIGQEGLTAADISFSGEWLAFGCASLGQLLVWEWQSESYILKQRGHSYGLNSLAFSPSGGLCVTGGEDNKVKLWNVRSGFCFATFDVHEAPITGVAFISNGSAVLSSSLDGTVQAHDLIRYRNFRTLVTPSPVQLTCLAVDPSGEVVAAGSVEPFEVYTWSLQTGKLLDVFQGHEAPLSGLVFSPYQGYLASASWDGTVKLWSVYQQELVETFEMPADVLAVSIRPDGKQLCASCLNGTLQLWGIEEGELEAIIECRRDISWHGRQADLAPSVGRRRTGYFTTLSYSADGMCVIAGGNSPFVCLYSVKTRILLRRFQLSLNRSLDGVLDPNNPNMPSPLTEKMELNGEMEKDSDLPGVRRKERESAHATCVRFSPTGNEWAVSSSDGLLLYSLDEALCFSPLELAEDITPESVKSAVLQEEWAKAVVLALRLGEGPSVRLALGSVPKKELPLTAKAVYVHLAEPLLRSITDGLMSGRRVEFHLLWLKEFLCAQGSYLKVRYCSYHNIMMPVTLSS